MSNDYQTVAEEMAYSTFQLMERFNVPKIDAKNYNTIELKIRRMLGTLEEEINEVKQILQLGELTSEDFQRIFEELADCLVVANNFPYLFSEDMRFLQAMDQVIRKNDAKTTETHVTELIAVHKNGRNYHKLNCPFVIAAAESKDPDQYYWIVIKNESIKESMHDHLCIVEEEKN